MTRTAVITGGTGGMGVATARLLGLDHRVVIADLDQARIDSTVADLVAQGMDASGSVCDITDRSSVDRLLAVASEGGHHVRAVVHTAGISPQMGTAERVARINGSGTVNVARAFLALAGEGDVLVNVASTAGHGLPAVLIPFRAFRLAETDPAEFEKTIVRRARVAGTKLHSGLAYGMSKAFVIWYTRKLAGAIRRQGSPHRVSVTGELQHADGRAREGPRSVRVPESRCCETVREAGGDRRRSRVLRR